MFCMSEVISSFKSVRAGSQVFALLMLFLCVIFHNMLSGKSLQLLCILSFGMLCLSAISIMFLKIMLLMTSAISCQRVKCAFISLVRTECGMFVMYCMQCCMSMSAVCSAWIYCLEEVYKCLQL